MKKIGILIPVFNNLSYTQNCLKNLQDNVTNNTQSKVKYEIIVIDDASTDGTYDWVKSNHPDSHTLQGNGDLWWSGGINVGARYAVDTLHCDYVLLWNNDIEVNTSYFNAIEQNIETYDDNTVIGSKIYGNLEKKLVWSMGGIFNPRSGKSYMIGYMEEDSPDLQKPKDADWLTGMGTLVPTKVIKNIGYWDEENFPQYIGDMEFTYRAKINGFQNIAVPNLIIWNDTSNTGLLHEGKWKKLVQMLSDRRSLYNYKVNMSFYKKYATSPLAYLFLLKLYLRFFGGFLKWKVLNMLGVKRKLTFDN